MKISIIAIGKNKDKHHIEIQKEYIKRITWKCVVDEIESKSFDDKNSEGDKILSRIKENDFIIVLDETGKNISSMEFSDIISKKQVHGISEIKFVIGGATGLSDVIKTRANLVLSFGKMTWPHQMVRTMLIEQIYRCFSIIKGINYHK